MEKLRLAHLKRWAYFYLTLGNEINKNNNLCKF